MRIRDLSIDERLKLVEDIWDSIAEDQEALRLTDEQRSELDARLERYRLSRAPGVDAFEAIEALRRTL